jgi:hypothetical protein
MKRKTFTLKPERLQFCPCPNRERGGLTAAFLQHRFEAAEMGIAEAGVLSLHRVESGYFALRFWEFNLDVQLSVFGLFAL